MVTPKLFEKFRSIEDFANSEVSEIEDLVKTCGLYKTKSASIKGMCTILHEKYAGIIPNKIEQLLELPGVGRKTANLIIGELYGKPAIVTDTHVMRLSKRLLGGDLHNLSCPEKIEYFLKEIIPEEESMAFCHRLVLHGRAVCKARNPDCGRCALSGNCCEFTKR